MWSGDEASSRVGSGNEASSGVWERGLQWGLGTRLAVGWGLGTRLAVGWGLGTRLAVGSGNEASPLPPVFLYSSVHKNKALGSRAWGTKAFKIITTTTPTIPYYTINPSYCWMPDLENQEWWVKKLFDGMPTLPTHPAFIPV